MTAGAIFSRLSSVIWAVPVETSAKQRPAAPPFRKHSQCSCFCRPEHTALDDGAGRDHADDVAFHKTLGLGRVFHLLTDGDLVALRDEAGHIALIAVERYAAHGRALFEAALLAREGQIQLPRDCERIVEEHLVEVTDAVEKNLIFMLFFDLQILLHHGRKLCHDRSPSSLVVGLPSKTACCKQNAALHCTAAFCVSWFKP